jgi:hypothetical protein
MGMSTHVTGFISDKNEVYIKHANVLKACLDAGIEKLPKETAEFFDSEYCEKHLLEEKLEIDILANEWEDEYREGYEILVKDLPKECYKIRFYNSY